MLQSLSGARSRSIYSDPDVIEVIDLTKEKESSTVTENTNEREDDNNFKESVRSSLPKPRKARAYRTAPADAIMMEHPRTYDHHRTVRMSTRPCRER